jgi:hypothetical protein
MRFKITQLYNKKLTILQQIDKKYIDIKQQKHDLTMVKLWIEFYSTFRYTAEYCKLNKNVAQYD